MFSQLLREKNCRHGVCQVTFHNKDGSFFPSQLVALDSGPAVLAAWLKHSLQRSRCLACGLPQAMKTSPRQVGKERGQGSYQVNPQVTSYHNLRSAPSLFSPIVGNLEAYDVVEVAQTIRLFGGEASGPEVWAQLCRTSAGPAIWTLQSDVEHVYLRKLLHSGDEEKPPKSWTAAAEQDPFGEAAQSVNFLLAASLGGPDSKKTLESVADHELQLGRESGALKHLEAEACQLRDEAFGL